MDARFHKLLSGHTTERAPDLNQGANLGRPNFQLANLDLGRRILTIDIWLYSSSVSPIATWFSHPDLLLIAASAWVKWHLTGISNLALTSFPNNCCCSVAGEDNHLDILVNKESWPTAKWCPMNCSVGRGPWQAPKPNLHIDDFFMRKLAHESRTTVKPPTPESKKNQLVDYPQSSF